MRTYIARDVCWFLQIYLLDENAPRHITLDKRAIELSLGISNATSTFTSVTCRICYKFAKTRRRDVGSYSGAELARFTRFSSTHSDALRHRDRVSSPSVTDAGYRDNLARDARTRRLLSLPPGHTRANAFHCADERARLRDERERRWNTPPELTSRSAVKTPGESRSHPLSLIPVTATISLNAGHDNNAHSVSLGAGTDGISLSGSNTYNRPGSYDGCVNERRNRVICRVRLYSDCTNIAISLKHVETSERSQEGRWLLVRDTTAFSIVSYRCSRFTRIGLNAFWSSNNHV